MNRAVPFHNVQITFPRASTVLITTYRSPSRLFIAGGGGELFSREGTTQEDPLTMLFYIFTALIISILRAKFDSVNNYGWLTMRRPQVRYKNLLELSDFYRTRVTVMVSTLTLKSLG